MIVGCDVEPSTRCRRTEPHRVAPTCADATRIVRGWLGIEADLRLQPLIRLSLLTLEPVDRPSDQDAYDGGV